MLGLRCRSPPAAGRRRKSVEHHEIDDRRGRTRARFNDTGLNAATRYRGAIDGHAERGQHHQAERRRAAASGAARRTEGTAPGRAPRRQSTTSTARSRLDRDAAAREACAISSACCHEQLRHESVIREDQREADARHRVDQCLPHRLRGGNAAFEPQAETIEAPCGRPPHQRTEGEPIEQRADGAETRAVVVPGEKADAVGRWNVLPVAAPLSNDRPRIGGAEFERGGSRSVCEIALADALAFASDLEAKPDARRVAEPLRLGVAGPWKIVNLRKAEVPALMELWRLRVCPESLHRRADENLDVNAHLARMSYAASVVWFLMYIVPPLTTGCAQLESP